MSLYLKKQHTNVFFYIFNLIKLLKIEKTLYITLNNFISYTFQGVNTIQ